MADHKMEGETGRTGTTMNSDAPKDSFTELHVDARGIATSLFNQHISATIRVLIDSGYPIALLLDCLLVASCEHYALGIINLIDQGQLTEEQGQKAIEGLGPVVVQGIKQSFNELLPEFKQGKEGIFE